MNDDISVLELAIISLKAHYIIKKDIILKSKLSENIWLQGVCLGHKSVQMLRNISYKKTMRYTRGKVCVAEFCPFQYISSFTLCNEPELSLIFRKCQIVIHVWFSKYTQGWIVTRYKYTFQSIKRMNT